MVLVKKTNNNWQPVENPALEIGQTLEVTDYQTLVRTGMAVLVDDHGNELELPGQMFSCPICFVQVEGLRAFNEHIAGHLESNKSNMEKVVKVKVADNKLLKDAQEKIEKKLAKEAKKKEFTAKMKAGKAKAKAKKAKVKKGE